MMSLSKIPTGGAATGYFEQEADRPSTYYADETNVPAGKWFGNNLSLFNHPVKAGDTVSTEQAQLLMDELTDPTNPLRKLSSFSAESIADGEAVGSWDLTFTIPKSASIVWATASPQLSREVEESFNQSIDWTIRWFENNVACTRAGEHGVVRMKVKGIVGIDYKHYDSRAHDPHLHHHMLVSNTVMGADGKIHTLDSRSIYRATVAMSEMQQLAFRNILAEKTGVRWESRTDPVSRKQVWEIAGIPQDEVQYFSKRDNQIESFMTKNRTKSTDFKGHHLAWNSTRKPKDLKDVTLGERKDRWRYEATQKGYTTGSNLADQVCDSGAPMLDATDILQSQDWLTLLQQAMNAVSLNSVKDLNQLHMEQSQWGPRLIRDLLHEGSRAHRTLITVNNIRASSARVLQQCGSIRMTEGQWRNLVGRLTDLELSQLTLMFGGSKPVELSEDQNVLPEPPMYETPELIQEEQDLRNYIQGTWIPSEGHRLPEREQIAQLVQEYSDRKKLEKGFGLSTDQRQAVIDILSQDKNMWALTGAAGTGKTTTAEAIRTVYEQLQGKGSVIGTAPSAQATHELSESLHVKAANIAMIVAEARTGAARKRMDLAYRNALQAGRDVHAITAYAHARAVWQATQIPQDGLVLVDEAGMVATEDLDALAGMCRQKNARILLMGDVDQLSPVGNGAGALSEVMIAGQNSSLTAQWRFKGHETLARHSNLLRSLIMDANVKVQEATVRNAEIQSVSDTFTRLKSTHTGSEDDLRKQVARQTVDDILHGVSNVLVSDGNQSIDALNSQITQILQEKGVVSTDHRMPLSDGLTCGKGDIIVTRQNDRTILAIKPDGSMQEVRNGQRWVVDKVTDIGVEAHETSDPKLTISLDKHYLRESTQLGYAVTVYRAQGMTMDHARYYVPLDATPTTNSVYTAITRGRAMDDMYVAVPDTSDIAQSRQLRTWLLHFRKTRENQFEKEGKSLWDEDKLGPLDRSNPQLVRRFYTSADLNPTDRDKLHHRMRDVIGHPVTAKFGIRIREEHLAEENSIAELGSKWRTLARALAEQQLARLNPRAGRLEEQDPVAWRKMVTRFMLLHNRSPQTAERIVRISQVEDEDPRNLADRLTKTHVKTTGRLLQYFKAVPAMGETDSERKTTQTMDSLQERIKKKLGMAVLKAENPATSPMWVRKLGPVPSADSAMRRRWEELVEAVNTYRSEHHIVDPERPLGGGIPLKDEQGQLLLRTIKRYTNWDHRRYRGNAGLARHGISERWFAGLSNIRNDIQEHNISIENKSPSIDGEKQQIE